MPYTGNLLCDGKPYEKKHPLTWPHHAKAYENECKHLASRSNEMTHPKIGKGTTNVVESSHSVLTKYRAKDWKI